MELVYQHLFDHMESCALVFRALISDDQPPDFEYVKVNQAMERLTGLKNIIGKRLGVLFPSLYENDRALLDFYVRVVTTGQAERIDTYYVESTRQWHQISAFCPVPMHLLVVFEVITERKRIELALQESEERLRLALDASGVGIFDWNMLTDRITWTPHHERLWGYQPGEFDNSYVSFVARVHPDDVPGIETEIARCQQERIGFEKEFRVQWPAGNVLWIISHGEFSYAPDGQPVRMLGAVHEITARKLAEAEILSSRNTLLTALNSMNDAVFITDTSAQLIDFNTAYVDFFRFKNREDCPRTLAEYPEILQTSWPCGKTASMDEWPVSRALRGESGTNVVYNTQRLDTGDSWVGQYSYAPLLTPEGRISGAVVTARDITEKKRQENALRESERCYRELSERLEQMAETRTLEARLASAAKTEFLSHMSHEIRTPLNALLGMTQLLEREPLNSQQRDTVSHIRAAGRSLLGLLNDILDLARIEAGKLELNLQPFCLNTLLGTVRSILEPAAKEKGLRFEIHAHLGAHTDLIGDSLRLEQVLMNLLGNAIKFTEQGGIVLRVLSQAEDSTSAHLQFEVEDTGIGMDAATCSRLFTPFTQGDGSINRRYGGAGLGLSISRQLVELMNGQLSVDSTPEKGSKFRLELTLLRPETPLNHAETSTIREQRPVAPRLRHLRVLVADDNAMNRTLIQRLLDTEGATATFVADGQQALDLLVNGPDRFDIALLDIQMPVLDGLSVAQRIRQQPELAQFPLFAFTAGVLVEQQMAAYSAGFNDFLSKPIDLEKMVSVLQRWQSLPKQVSQAIPVTRTTSAANSLPAIAGLDTRQAEKVLGDDREFFLELLGLFVTSFQNAVADTRRDIDTGETEAAVRRLHSLRGSISNLGGGMLMESAHALEQALQTGRSARDTAPLMTAFAACMDEVLTSSRPWLEASTGAAAEPGPTIAEQTVDPAQLQALRDALRQYDLIALEYFAGLETALADCYGEDLTRAVRSDLAGLDYDRVLVRLVCF